MRILSVASEVFPFVKTGGLADVTGALPKALREFDIATITLVPGYPALLPMAREGAPLAVFEDVLGETAHIRLFQTEEQIFLVLDIPSLYDRPGTPYLDEQGRDHADNWKRFAALSLAAAKIANGALPGWVPDLVHTHDWQTALTSVYLRSMNNQTPVVLTIHNIAFQGQFSSGIFPWLQLPMSTFSMDCLEYYGDVCFLKGGLTTSNIITTVSPTYSREIMTPKFGMGLQGVLRARANVVKGILNGTDDDIWDPAKDPYLERTFDLSTVSDRRINRLKLESESGLDSDDGPIFAAVSRLTWQKGVDMLAEVAEEIAYRGGKLIVCGRGDSAIEDLLLDTAQKLPGRMAVHIGYDERIAHLIHGGADAIVQPSRFEPCGLTQLYGLRYGNVPIVSRTGGLAETVIDANDAAMGAGVATGFQFHPVTTEGLRHAIRRAIDAYASPAQWRQLQAQGMSARFTWDRSAKLYADLYRDLVPERKRSGLNIVRAVAS
ncbi:glycogen synthase GlgA [Rhizobium sp. KVB221]|uniref:Glycogen synthase n=1 Tax=Rhizobium setariae TaxID=2801340 RepID=A0A936YU22_9HYPH|nr:glycogen synthase GlgA [Rhizobium setariae]MBL0372867.1 glycogen synthase GlgA [Rhizobium setariae]